ncbi:hypothetical protein [Paludisphaera mucosa]|uniref:Uncharacterized protein n=1 Tax=Paludisphaera mucosa TaxID=3030827 RepID=A0ABT6F9X0_9BACT|nr:hypothetical protein [Paludisphaera mucosa]MDG3004383.1 hypothetical protein [Paludisphaera mucosa]
MSQPALQIQVGVLKVTIGRSFKKSRDYYTLIIIRSFRRRDDTRKESHSFNTVDALPMADVLREAYAWIKTQKCADAKGRRERDDVTANQSNRSAREGRPPPWRS